MCNSKRHFIDLAPLWGKGAIFNVALSDRSDGKTTAIQAQAIADADKNGKRAIISRRFSTEITAGYFDEMIKNLNNKDKNILSGRDYDFAKPRKGNLPKPAQFLLQPREGGEKIPVVDFVPLSLAGRYKSSLGHETHGNIYIDEYIPLDNRYLPNECEQMLELYKTVDREHFDTRLTVTGNRVTRYNPIFEYFNINEWKKGVNLYQNGALAVLVYSSANNRQIAQKSAFSDLIRGTKYEGYNNGEFLRAPDMAIMRTHSTVQVVRISHGGKVYGVYQAGAALVIDDNAKAHGVCVCVEPAPTAHNATWLQAVPYIREILRQYKHANSIYCANELIAHSIKTFFDKI